MPADPGPGGRPTRRRPRDGAAGCAEATGRLIAAAVRGWRPGPSRALTTSWRAGNGRSSPRRAARRPAPAASRTREPRTPACAGRARASRRRGSRPSAHSGSPRPATRPARRRDEEKARLPDALPRVSRARHPVPVARSGPDESTGAASVRRSRAGSGVNSEPSDRAGSRSVRIAQARPDHVARCSGRPRGRRPRPPSRAILPNGRAPRGRGRECCGVDSLDR